MRKRIQCNETDSGDCENCELLRRSCTWTSWRFLYEDIDLPSTIYYLPLSTQSINIQNPQLQSCLKVQDFPTEEDENGEAIIDAQNSRATEDNEPEIDDELENTMLDPNTQALVAGTTTATGIW